jgi:hypothetical protein
LEAFRDGLDKVRRGLGDAGRLERSLSLVWRWVGTIAKLTIVIGNYGHSS